MGAGLPLAATVRVSPAGSVTLAPTGWLVICTGYCTVSATALLVTGEPAPLTVTE